MATRVVVNNSPTQHRSGSIPQTTSGVKLSVPIVQPEGAPSIRPAPDEMVDRILVRAKSPLAEEDARELVEVLEKMMEPHCQISLHTRRRCFRGLVKICGEYGVLPSSYVIHESKIRKLGDSPVSSGGFSEVWPGAYDGEKAVAIKVIRYYESDDVQQMRKMKKNFCREVITWKRLSHPNVLELIGVMMKDKECLMVAPWMENGNIVEFLKANPWTNPLKLLEDAANGLQYLHSIDLAHGDLKGGNILVSDDGCACLADVGLTRMAGDIGSATAASNLSTSTGAITLRWSPPELLDPEKFGSKRDGPTKKSDMYSMGMTIYEVLTDKTPFFEYKDLVAMRIILEGVRPKKPIFAITRGYTEELWEMTITCWEEDPVKRPTVDRVLGVLRSAAERWESKYGELATQDDWSPTSSPTSSTEELNSEHENESFTPTSPSKSPSGEDETLEEMLCGILPNSQIIPESKIEKLGDSPVSSGSFSHVWQGVYGNGGGSVAIKFMRHAGSSKVENTKEDFCREVVTWKRLSHPNILELIGVMVGDGGCAMVSPWMENGNIIEFLRKDSRADPLKLLEDAACGLQYLHSLDLAHGDLKGRNILISGNGRACLADFALMRSTNDLDPLTVSSTPTGGISLRWAPPERLGPERFGSTVDDPGKKSDMYSMGMTIYEVLTGRIPFYEHEDPLVVYNILQGVRPKAPVFATTRGYTEELWRMTTICWEEDPNRRPTVDHVLGVLRSAAEKWKSRHREPVTLSPPDNPLQQTVTKTPTPAPPTYPSTPSVSTPSTANNVAFRSTLATPREENTKGAQLKSTQTEETRDPPAKIKSKDSAECGPNSPQYPHVQA